MLEVFRRADEADLDDLHRHVFEDQLGLLGNRLVVHGEMVDDFGGVTRVGAGDDRQRVRTDRTDGHHVARQATGAAGVIGVEDQHASWLIRFL